MFNPETCDVRPETHPRECAANKAGMKPNGIVTLLTDFGTEDAFVGTMKGVILGINPEVCIVDLSHEIEAHRIEAAAFLLKTSYAYFPEGTVHVVVVDPGVGSSRRAIAASAGGYFFVAPDNGVLAYVYRDHPACEVFELTNREYFLPEISATFHGRDVFAPVAAHLSKGVPLEELGHSSTDFMLGEIKEPVRRGNQIEGHIVYVDRFGNLITDIPRQMVQEMLSRRPFRIALPSGEVTRITASYFEGQPGEPIAVVGSSGYLEIALNLQSAAQVLGLKVGDHFTVYLV